MKINFKHFFLAAVVAACGAGSAAAQTSQGNFVISGNMHVSVYDSETNFPYSQQSISQQSKYGAISVNPGFGFFVRDGLETGAGIGLDYNWNKSTEGESISQGRSYGVSFAPYIRKYIYLTERLMLVGTAHVSVGRTNFVYPLVSSEHHSRSINMRAGISPGLTYFVTDRFGVNASFGSLGYTRTTNKPNNREVKGVENNFGVSFSLSTLHFGLSYFILR